MEELLARVPPVAFGWAGVVTGAVLLLWALWAKRRQRLVEDLPTSKTTGVFIGQVELKGTAEAEVPLHSHLAGVSCVQYAWSVEEHWSRTVTESYTDKDGKSRTRTRTESGWKTVASGGEAIDFYLQDDCGVIRVRPEGAELEGRSVFGETCGREHPLYYGKGPASAVAHSTHKRRFTEKAIPLHAPLYVLGRARLREDIVAPEIAQDSQGGVFLVSTRSEEEVRGGLAAQFWLLGILAVAAAIGGWIWADHRAGKELADQVRFYTGVGGGAVGAWIVGWVLVVYNSLVGLHQRVRQGWSNIDVQLKRRADLIPAIVSAVTGLRDHERTVQAEVALMRGQIAVTPPGMAGPDAAACAAPLRAIVERYPELKSNDAFQRLQQELVGTEDRIALARSYYNDIVTFYNTRLGIIPDRFIAALGRLRARQLMEAEGFERAAVLVKLAES